MTLININKNILRISKTHNKYKVVRTRFFGGGGSGDGTLRIGWSVDSHMYHI